MSAVRWCDGVAVVGAMVVRRRNAAADGGGDDGDGGRAIMMMVVMMKVEGAGRSGPDSGWMVSGCVSTMMGWSVGTESTVMFVGCRRCRCRR